jgi:polysaccharide export outer membrane protein
MRKLIIFFVMVFIASCSSSEVLKENPDVVHKDASLVAEYRIGVDDIVQVSVWKNPELTITVPVRPDGKISVPLIGDIAAASLTPQVVSNDIQRKLSKFIRNPKVTVILTKLNSHEYLSRVRVTGAVQNQISIPYRQGITVLDAILVAGGINEFASGNRTKIYRRASAETKVYNVYLDDILNDGKLKTNYILIPGDIITVPERSF